MKRKQLLHLLTLGALTATGLVGKAHAQSADALIDKLVDKGVLTVKEANELREEADKNFSQAYSVKSGMPDWVNALKINGDVRLRYEGFYSDAQVDRSTTATPNFQDFTERNRFRYRLRLGVTATFADNFEAGLRLTSSDPAAGDSNFGGDPISGNTTFQNNASKKFIYVDQAYGRWYFLNGPSLSGNVTGGKMENPFVLDEMVFDPDYTPEGAAIQSAYRLNDEHALKLNVGAFVLDELAASGHDPYLLGAQLRWDATWSKKLSTTAGLSGLSIQNDDQLITAAVPNQNAGNTRFNGGSIGAGQLAYHFNPFVVDAAVTYSLDRFPLYKGAFPIKVGGEYMNNPAAPYNADNYAWNAGITFGKSGKRGTWDLSYTYRWLGGDSWYEELVDSDFGAVYAGRNQPAAGYRVPPGSNGYFAGTNVKGHVVRFAYSPSDSLTLSAKWFLTELIEPFPAASDSQISRVQVDGSFKF